MSIVNNGHRGGGGLPFCWYAFVAGVILAIKTYPNRGFFFFDKKGEAGFWVFEEIVPYYNIHQSSAAHRDCHPAPNRAFILGHRSKEWNAWERVNPYVRAETYRPFGIMNMPCPSVGEERIAFAWTGFDDMINSPHHPPSDEAHLKKAWCPFKFVCVNTTRALTIPGCYKFFRDSPPYSEAYIRAYIRAWQKENSPPSFCHVP